MANNDLEKVKRHVMNWGKQTVGFAMNLRATEAGTLKETPEFLKAMATETIKITEELWSSALSECSQPVKPPELMMLFARNVLNWCGDHRRQ